MNEETYTLTQDAEPKKRYLGLKILIAVLILTVLAYIIIPPLFVSESDEPNWEGWYETHITANSADEAIKTFGDDLLIEKFAAGVPDRSDLRFVLGYSGKNPDDRAKWQGLCYEAVYRSGLFNLFEKSVKTVIPLTDTDKQYEDQLFNSDTLYSGSEEKVVNGVPVEFYYYRSNGEANAHFEFNGMPFYLHSNDVDQLNQTIESILS